MDYKHLYVSYIYPTCTHPSLLSLFTIDQGLIDHEHTFFLIGESAPEGRVNSYNPKAMTLYSTGMSNCSSLCRKSKKPVLSYRLQSRYI